MAREGEKGRKCREKWKYNKKTNEKRRLFGSKGSKMNVQHVSICSFKSH